MKTPYRRLWVWLLLGVGAPLIFIYLTLSVNEPLSNMTGEIITFPGADIPEVQEDIAVHDTIYDNYAAADTIGDHKYAPPKKSNYNSAEEIAKTAKNKILGRMKYYVPNKMKIGVDSIALLPLLNQG